LKHVAVHAAGRSQEIFERFLLRNKIYPKVVLVTPHFLSLPMVIAKTDLVATVPHAVGMFFSGSRANIKAVLPPFSDAPRIVLKQHWHRKANHDPRNRWLRLLVSELFTQESDEWKTKRAS
jgi:DNA-binding transcriptional LysR family regulator